MIRVSELWVIPSWSKNALFSQLPVGCLHTSSDKKLTTFKGSGAALYRWSLRQYPLFPLPQNNLAKTSVILDSNQQTSV